jgi:hypothetical protein
MADNVFRVTLVYTCFGQQMNNVLHFSGPSSDPAQMEALATEVAGDWIDQCHFKQTRNVKYIGVFVRLLESQFPTFQKIVNIDGVATASGNDMTFHAFIIRLYGNIVGRHGRGRVYIGGIKNDATFNGFITQTYFDQWQISRGVWLNKWGPNGTSTFRLGITRKQNPTANFVPVIDIKVASTLGVQRRRNLLVGI